MTYHLYILYSDTRDKFYIGITGDDLKERLRRHNANHKGYTGKTGDWKIVHAEAFADKESAVKRERQIKAWKSKKRIEDLIDSEHSA